MSAIGNITVPFRVLGGSNIAVAISGVMTLPLLSISGLGTPGRASNGNIQLPVLSIFGGRWAADGGITLPVFGVSGTMHINPKASGALTIPALGVFGIGYNGQAGTGNIALPLIKLTGAMHSVPMISGGILLPVVKLNGFLFGGASRDSLYQTVVINTRHFAVSNYLNFGFDSFCEFPGGVFLASNSSGLYQLYAPSGTDNGDLIPAELEFGTTDFGEQTLKNCPDGYINYRGDGEIEIDALADELESGPDSTTVKAVADGRLRNYKFKLSKYRKGKNWRFSVKNIDGSDLDINEVAIFYDVLSRRI